MLQRKVLIMSNNKINIIIVDSGVDTSHKRFQGIPVIGFSFQNKTLMEDFADEYGHGTAIFDIIKSVSDFANIINIKIPNIENSVCEEELIHVLQYIEAHLKCNILNLSLGINVCKHYDLLKKCCDDLIENGTIIVAAFDNNGAISYPAAFPDVLGVVSGARCNKINDFQYYEDDVVNIAAKGSIQRVAWKNSQYLLVGGNSFACAHVAVQVAHFMKNGQLTIAEVREKFRKISISEHKCKNSESGSFELKIKRAAIFPFNKEMHSLIRYPHLLSFELVDVYDVKYSFTVGATTSFLMNDMSVKNYIIKNISEVDWDSFDTLIVGHTNRLSSLLNDKEIKKRIINEAISRKKQIYSFDDLAGWGYKNSESVYFPVVTYKNLPPFRFGMLYRISKPVVGVFGTSSQQGKFTLQLKMREILLTNGYRVGQVGTEPSSILFGMDYCYPMGYNSSVYLKEYDQIRYLNYIMNGLCQKEPDIIIVGSQSGTVPYDIANINLFNSSQFHFLMGTQPDCVVLTINPFDDFSYIQRTMTFIESSVRCKVVSLVIFPMDLKKDWSGIYGKKKKLSTDAINSIKRSLYEHFKVPVFELGNENDMIEMVDIVTDFFSR